MARHGLVDEHDVRGASAGRVSRHLAGTGPGVQVALRTTDLEMLAAQRAQHLQGAVDWLGNAVEVHHAKAAVVGHAGKVVFFKDVGKSPVAVAIDQVIDMHGDAHCQRGGKRAVVKRVARVGADAPLGVIERQRAGAGARFLGARAHHQRRRMLQLRDGVGVNGAKRIGRVVMRADEVHGRGRAFAVSSEVVQPGVVRRGRAADLQACIDRFDSLGSGAVELEVGRLVAGPEGLEVGLVPAFERPLRHLVKSVALDPVRHQPAHQLAPLRVILGRRNIALVAKDDIAPGGQHARHERQFNHRLHADGEQKVKDAVGVEERIQRLVVLANQCSHVVIK